MEEELPSDANNVTADTFIHASNTQGNNTNAIFISEKRNKLDELTNSLKYLTIKYSKYYQSDAATGRDAQGDPAQNPETITHTSNGNGTVTHTRNRNFEHKLLSNRTIPVVVPTMTPRFDQRIATIVVVP